MLKLAFDFGLFQDSTISQQTEKVNQQKEWTIV